MTDPSPSPRDLHRLTGRDEWTTAIRAGRVVPRDVSDAFAVAFTRACLDAIGSPEMDALQAGEDVGGHMRASYLLLARSLGMGRERFRLTLQGARWVTLPELAAALADPLVGRHLRPLLPSEPGVLGKDQDSEVRAGFGQGGGDGWEPSRPPETRRSNKMTEAEVSLIEQRVRADVTRLDRHVHAAAARNEPLDVTARWDQVRTLIDTPRTPSNVTPRAGMASRVRASGVPNLAGLLRDILRGAGRMKSHRIKSELRKRVPRNRPAISGDQVDAALARLAKRGEVSRTAHGEYEATDKMRGGGLIR